MSIRAKVILRVYLASTSCFFFAEKEKCKPLLPKKNMLNKKCGIFLVIFITSRKNI